VQITVVLDDELLAKAMAASQLPTEQAVIEAGLRLLVRIHAQQQIRSLRGQLHWEGDLDAMRNDNPPAE
jgi:Arc/MetJ family transcription regulator